MSFATPEQIAAQLYAINSVLVADLNNPNITSQQLLADLQAQQQSLTNGQYTGALDNLKTLLMNYTDPNQLNYIQSCYTCCNLAYNDLSAAIGDLQSGGTIQQAKNLLMNTQQGTGAIQDVLAGFIQTVQWGAAAIAYDQSSGNTGQLLSDLQSLNTYLTTFSAADQWTALGLTKAQYQTLTTSLGNAIKDLQANPPNMTQFAIDWKSAYTLIQNAQLPPIDGSTQDEEKGGK